VVKKITMLAAAVVLGTALWTAGVRFVSEIRTVFRDAPRRVIAPEIRAQVAALKTRMPAGAPILYFDQFPRDHWRSRLWQRAFYPVRLIILEREKASERPPLETLRRLYSARFALAVGNPPEDPGFAWHEALPPVPGASSTVWFGELKP
jgi:hypothetical protein